MSANKHTPGPWIFTGAVGFGRMIKAADGSQIAVAYGPDVTPEGDSNARLIAAAPELLAALRAVIKVVDDTRPSAPQRVGRTDGRRVGPFRHRQGGGGGGMSELRIFVLDATAGVAWVVDSLSGEVLGEGDGGDASTVVKEVLKDAITACGVPDVMVLHVPAETVATASRGRVRHKQERLRAHRDFLPEEQS